MPANAIYFATYEAFQDFIKQTFPQMHMEVLSAIVSGGMAGIAYWVVGMPPDVLKSRLQTGALVCALFWLYLNQKPLENMLIEKRSFEILRPNNCI